MSRVGGRRESESIAAAMRTAPPRAPSLRGVIVGVIRQLDMVRGAVTEHALRPDPTRAALDEARAHLYDAALAEDDRHGAPPPRRPSVAARLCWQAGDLLAAGLTSPARSYAVQALDNAAQAKVHPDRFLVALLTGAAAGQLWRARELNHSS